MEKLGLNEIRSLFLKFFESKGHLVHASFPLIPDHDKSLMLINSGMAPLKPYFSGLKTPPSKRMTTCQKCLRTGDIDNIGHTDRHGTFFEMMGNFSFGDYFKEQSLTWGWEFITEVLKLPKDRIWATIYEDDDEAFDIWKNKIGMPEEHIVRLGKEDNFWEIGLGPCGPCSEIYFDRGEEYGCGKPDCKPGCECDRYIEFWNHVFTQFSKEEDGSYTPLEHPNIDTGMGLERMACIMQETDSIFAIDTIAHILKQVEKVTGVEYHHGKAKEDISLRIITDHVRSVTFMISDGILPSNEGRGYVLRRLIRRAARHGKLLGVDKPFLAGLVDYVVEVSGDAYPDLVANQEYIKKIISIEEEKFASTIDQGTGIINDYMKELSDRGSRILDGEKAFKLYDTYGFPIELTNEILEENGFQADQDGFEKLMQKQKEMARGARKDDAEVAWQDENIGFFNSGDATVFTGYDKLEDTASVEAMFENRIKKDELTAGQDGAIILDRTPFYAEMGGQVGDRGILTTDNAVLTVNDTVKAKDFYVHKVHVEKGSIKTGDKVTASVDPLFRHRTARNHTATHILQAALKQVLGGHVSQAGSYVDPDGLRFDFTHFEPVSAEDLQKVEDLANDEIARFEDVTTQVMTIDEARETGATAIFDDKYSDEVRVVSVGDFSKEFCGGTHVANSGLVGAIKITSESGVAAGVRRIEAVTGDGIARALGRDEKLIADTASAMKTQPANLQERAEALNEEIRALKKELDGLKKQSMGSSADELIANAEEINGAKLVTAKFDGIGVDELRDLSDQLKSKSKGLVNVLAAVNDGKVTFLISISDELVEKGLHAGKMIKEVAKAAGGGGGGKANMAQAGARDASRIDDAFAKARELLAE